MTAHRSGKNSVQCWAFFKLLLVFRRWSTRMDGHTGKALSFFHWFYALLANSALWEEICKVRFVIPR